MNDTKTKNKNRVLGTVLTLLGAALWGSCAVFSKHLMDTGELDTMWMTNFRMLMSGIILVSFSAIRRPRSFCDIWKDKKSLPRLFAIGALAFGVCQVSYFLSINYCNAGLASAIQQTAPVFVLIFVLFKEHRLPRLSEVLVLLLVLFGSFMIATNGKLDSLSVAPAALIWGLISALTAALYIVLPGKLVNRYGTCETTGWGMIIGGLLVAPVCKLWMFPATISAATALGLFYIIVPGSVVAFAVFLYGATFIDPVKAGVYNLFEPVVATFASLIFLSQAFTTGDYIGIASILIGIAFLTVSKK
ncbi:MAG: EamA family transporter [Clostridiales bacterium]|nr:EamA family transporter [Candidatus Crickella caballi]